MSCNAIGSQVFSGFMALPVRARRAARLSCSMSRLVRAVTLLDFWEEFGVVGRL